MPASPPARRATMSATSAVPPSGSVSPACRARARRCSSPRWSMRCCTAARLPVFEAYAAGRIARAVLEPQPDDAVPRFDVERHVRGADRADRQLAGIHPPDLPSCGSISPTSRRVASAPPERHAGDRHRRLSRRMAARPAAADEQLSRLVARGGAPVARAGDGHRDLPAGDAHLQTLDPKAPADETAAREAADTVHGTISPPAAPTEPSRSRAAARPLPDAGRPRRLAGPHLRAARSAGTERGGAGLDRGR